MNSTDTVLFGACGLAIVAIVGWMLVVSARLKAIERAIESIAGHTDALREIVGLLRSVDGNTSLLGGLGHVFRPTGRKKS